MTNYEGKGNLSTLVEIPKGQKFEDWLQDAFRVSNATTTLASSSCNNLFLTFASELAKDLAKVADDVTATTKSTANDTDNVAK
jgi:hypothetical protein